MWPQKQLNLGVQHDQSQPSTKTLKHIPNLHQTKQFPQKNGKACLGRKWFDISVGSNYDVNRKPLDYNGEWQVALIRIQQVRDDNRHTTRSIKSANSERRCSKQPKWNVNGRLMIFRKSPLTSPCLEWRTICLTCSHLFCRPGGGRFETLHSHNFCK